MRIRKNSLYLFIVAISVLCFSLFGMSPVAQAGGKPSISSEGWEQSDGGHDFYLKYKNCAGKKITLNIINSKGVAVYSGSVTPKKNKGRARFKVKSTYKGKNLPDGEYRIVYKVKGGPKLDTVEYIWWP